jgi:hypothetical protein
MARAAVRSFMIRLRVQLRVLRALLMREMQTRFGRENLGFFWLMGEPLFLTCAVMVLWASWRPPCRWTEHYSIRSLRLHTHYPVAAHRCAVSTLFPS